MGVSWLTVSVVTVFWGIVGIPLPLILGKGPNKGVTQVVLVITAATGWLFWVLSYLHQMNPLIGPQLHAPTVLALKYLWDGTINIDDLPSPEPNITTPFDTTPTSVETTPTPFTITTTTFETPTTTPATIVDVAINPVDTATDNPVDTSTNNQLDTGTDSFDTTTNIFDTSTNPFDTTTNPYETTTEDIF